MKPSSWGHEQFVRNLSRVGAKQYHHLHPFHLDMNRGALSPSQVRGWIAHRYYYQKTIPMKDATILARCPLREVRRIWIHRIVDHDGACENEGGIEAWIRLGE